MGVAEGEDLAGGIRLNSGIPQLAMSCFNYRRWAIKSAAASDSAVAAISISSGVVIHPTDNLTAPRARSALHPIAASTPLTASASE